MEELLQVAKKQLLFQKITAGLLVALLAVLLTGGSSFLNQMSQMTTAIENAAEKLQDIDIKSVNGTIEGAEKLLQSADALSEAVESVTERVEQFDTWLSGMF